MQEMTEVIEIMENMQHKIAKFNIQTKNNPNPKKCLEQIQLNPAN